MRCRIHRGCHEIGGNCVEVESEGKRIVLDIGWPLKNDKNAKIPDVSGLRSPDESLLGIFISHPHPDHYGFLKEVTEPVPVYMGQAAYRIIGVSAYFTLLPSAGETEPTAYVVGEPIEIGPFTITPFPIDHSAHDSYCLLIEANGKRLLYSGDIRGHGRNPEFFQELITNPPPDIDVLICEGTQVGRKEIANFDYPTEYSVADRMLEIFNETAGMCLTWCSGQNIDRLISIWQATQKSGRQLVLDLYTAEVIKAAQDDSLPTPGKDGVKVYVPSSQRSKIIRKDDIPRLNSYYPCRIYAQKREPTGPADLEDMASSTVLVFRPSMLSDFKKTTCLDGARLISSMWSGYVHENNSDLLEMTRMGIERDHVHTSGHATVDELQQFVDGIDADRIVPIHLQDREGFSKLSDRVDFKDDHQWWEV